MAVQHIFTLSLGLVLLLTAGVSEAQDPMISISSTDTNLKTGASFDINCTVMPFDSTWVTEVVKTMSGSVMADNGGWSIAKNAQLNSGLAADEGNRYTATYSGTEADNMTLTSVSISSAKPEDSGTWTCRVLKSDVVIKNASEVINLNIDGPLRSLKIYENATFRNDVSSQVLSDGNSYTFMHGEATRLTCEAGAPTSTAPGFKVMISGDPMKDITSEFDVENSTSTSDTPKAGGLVKHTTYVAKINSNYMPNVSDHGKEFVCEVSVQGYPNVNASFTLNIESAPHIKCMETHRIQPDDKEAMIECTVIANPAVTTVNWGVPAALASLKENMTYSNELMGITLTASVKIPDMKTDYLGNYNVTATNKYGTVTKPLVLTDEAVSEAVIPKCSVAMALLSLLLAVVNHR